MSAALPRTLYCCKRKLRQLITQHSGSKNNNIFTACDTPSHVNNGSSSIAKIIQSSIFYIYFLVLRGRFPFSAGYRRGSIVVLLALFLPNIFNKKTTYYIILSI